VDSTIFPLSDPKLTQAEALVVSRRALVDLATICSTILLVHVCASWWKEARVRKDGIPDSERASVPRSEMRRLRLYVVFGLVVGLVVVAMQTGFYEMGWGIWQSPSVCPPHLLMDPNANHNRSSHLIRYELHRTLAVFIVLSGRPVSRH